MKTFKDRKIEILSLIGWEHFMPIKHKEKSKYIGMGTLILFPFFWWVILTGIILNRHRLNKKTFFKTLKKILKNKNKFLAIWWNLVLINIFAFILVYRHMLLELNLTFFKSLMYSFYIITVVPIFSFFSIMFFRIEEDSK